MLESEGGFFMDTCIEVNRLTKAFRGRNVVDDLTFHIQSGEVFGLLGHNGAGKTTTIETILGLHHPTSGKTMIHGLEAKKHRKTLFEKIGVQLQTSFYQDNIKVKEVLEETAALYQHPANYHELLQRFQMDTFANQYVEKLSGGERQKLSVIAALLPNPEILFLDELTTGLDAAARREVWNILKDLKDQGMTIVLTTHYMEEAEYLCDHILLMKNGKKMIEGTVEEVLKSGSYKNLEEAYLSIMKEEQA